MVFVNKEPGALSFEYGSKLTIFLPRKNALCIYESHGQTSLSRAVPHLWGQAGRKV
jgi:hypothetical protein